MLQKIKDLMHIKEEIDSLKNSFSDYKESFNSAKSELSELKSSIQSQRAEINSLAESQKALIQQLQKSLSEIDEIKNSMKKELYEMNLIKSQVQNKILEKFDEELKKQLKINLETLKTEYDSYDNARKEMEKLVGKTSQLTDHINKITEISQNIKKEDFELTRFSREIFNADKEKLELMRKIDALERLVGQMRRNTHDRR